MPVNRLTPLLRWLLGSARGERSISHYMGGITRKLLHVTTKQRLQLTFLQALDRVEREHVENKNNRTEQSCRT